MKIQNFTYLILDLLSVSIPLACSFEHKLEFWKKWKYYLPALFGTATLFLIWDFFKTKYGIWSFNSNYVLGIYIFGMPLEEYLFFITIPYACTFIYETLEKFLTKPLLPAHTPKVLLLIVVVCGVMSFMLTHKIYTWSVLFGVAIITPLLLQIISGMKLQSFLLMYCIAIIPMLIVNGILTSLPVVIYNNNENLNLRIGSIPIEDFFYNFILMSMNIGLYELMKTRSLKKVLKRELPLVQLF